MPPIAPAQRSLREEEHTVPGTTASSSLLMDGKKRASGGTLQVPRRVPEEKGVPAQEGTSAHTVVPPIITPLVGGASERERIITPFRADVFERELRRFDLHYRYPELPDKLRYGFPIGNFQPRSFTFTPNNSRTCIDHLDFVKEYVTEQVSLGRMTGPYSQHRIKEILGTHFISSPLSVIQKAGKPGAFRLVQNCSFKDPNGISVNDEIDSDNFPTTWGTAAEVAEIVSNHSITVYTDFSVSQACRPEYRIRDAHCHHIRFVPPLGRGIRPNILHSQMYLLVSHSRKLTPLHSRAQESL